jgi:hypothetical protein
MNEIICKLQLNLNGDVIADDFTVEPDGHIKRIERNLMGRSIEEILLEDKKYGLLKPKNGKSYGYFIINKDVELTNKQVRKGITRGLFRWYLELSFKFHRVRHRADADLVYEFRSEANDPILNAQTLAYMYYPLGGPNDGICVINTRPFFTLHGNGIDMHYIDPINYPEPGSGTSGSTIDLDQTLGHEDGHGLLGLPHVSGLMAPNYAFMTEHPSEMDIIRGSAKIPKRSWSSRKYQRLKEWFTHASER